MARRRVFTLSSSPRRLTRQQSVARTPTHRFERRGRRVKAGGDPRQPGGGFDQFFALKLPNRMISGNFGE